MSWLLEGNLMCLSTVEREELWWEGELYIILVGYRAGMRRLVLLRRLANPPPDICRFGVADSAVDKPTLPPLQDHEILTDGVKALEIAVD